MVKPNPALGISATFPEAQFRNAISFAMQMGTPKEADRRPVFVRKGAGRTYWKGEVQILPEPRLDRDGRPLDPTIEVRQAADQHLTDIECAIEVDRADADELPVGNFRPTKAVVTLSDDQYARVQGCRELLYNADRYAYGYEPELNGLFEVTFHTMIFYCRDDT